MFVVSLIVLIISVINMCNLQYLLCCGDSRLSFCHTNTVLVTKIASKRCLLQACAKIVVGRGFASDHWGSLQCSPRLPCWWVGGWPPHPYELHPCLALWALLFRPPNTPKINPAYSIADNICLYIMKKSKAAVNAAALSTEKC